MAFFFYYSLNAFESYKAGEEETTLAWIDSAYQHPYGYYEILSSCVDKPFMRANIYASRGEYEKAIQQCDLLLTAYQNCDPKYRPWVVETEERKNRLQSQMNHHQ